MVIKNKIFLGTFLFLSIFSFANADTNRDYLLSEITKIENNLVNLKIDKTKDLETKVIGLSNTFDQSFSTLGYDAKVVNYLVGLGKISSNFKQDISLELNSLNSEINTKTSNELNSLYSIKNNVLINYSTVSDTEKEKILTSIQGIDKNYNDLNSYFSLKITSINDKYSTNLNSYKVTLKQAYESNISLVKSLKNFDENYNDLYSLYGDFSKNYAIFKEKYLSYAGDLLTFSKTKQAFYTEMLRKELEGLRDVNIQSNKSLELYSNDMNRLIQILLENFESGLKTKIDDSYGVIYSDSDIKSLDSRYLTLKNRYYDSDGNIIVSEFNSNSGALLEIIDTKDKLNIINTNIKILLGSEDSNSYENVKIRLENEIIKYYNENYIKYRQDLINELKQKLSFIAQDTKNMILASDNIDIRYNILQEKISKLSDFDKINIEIDQFKKDINKYSYLNNVQINLKISKIINNLQLYAIGVELNKDKYSKMVFTKYSSQLETILIKLKNKYPDTYIEKLNLYLSKLDVILNKKPTDKTKYLILNIKKTIINFINL